MKRIYLLWLVVALLPAEWFFANGMRSGGALSYSGFREDDDVEVAYGQQKEVEITGSVVSVSGDELRKSPVANLANALQGRLPGLVVVQTSGMPGDDEPLIRVRGTGSLNDAAPLVLVDGVERPFSQLDPNEIESISILKDGAAAVYGMRGANGVILVTTRRGTSGKASVTASVSAGVQTATKFIDMADSYKYGQLHNYATITDALPVEMWPESLSVGDYSSYSDCGLRFSQEAMEHFRLKDMKSIYPSTDWTDCLMRNSAWQENANVNVRGGSDRLRYFVSVGFLNQNSLFKSFTSGRNGTFDYRRFNYRANFDIDIARYSSLSISLGGNVRNRNMAGSGEEALFEALRGVTPYAGYGVDDKGRHIVSDPNLTGLYGIDAVTAYRGTGYAVQNVNSLNFDLQYRLDMSFITRGLDFKAKASYNSDYAVRKDLGSAFGDDLRYVSTIVDGEQVLRKENIALSLPYGEDKWGGRNWYAEAGFNYARRFGDHNLGALLLYNQTRTYYPENAVCGLATKSYAGLVGRITYNYAARYLIDFSIGYNGSDSFAPGRRFGTFPSLSLGWVPSNEEWWTPVKDAISYLKIRASWGMTGSDVFGDIRTLYFPDATWEKSEKTDLGFDIAFFKDRLRIGGDFFWQNRTDIIISNAAFLPAIAAWDTSFINDGQVRSRGYELTLGWEDKAGDFHYSISPSLSFATNRITALPRDATKVDNCLRTGASVGQTYGYELFELYMPGTEERYLEKYGSYMPNQRTILKYGDCVYADLDGDDLINENDRKPLGYTDIPEINWAVNVALQWKGLDFSMLWTGAGNVNRTLGGYFREGFGATGFGALSQWTADNSWTVDNPASALPRVSFANGGRNSLDSRIWMLDSGYTRLKNLQIGYTFNRKKDSNFFNYIRLYVSGENLLTISGFKVSDPESLVGGNVRYPITRIVNMGAQFNF